MPEPRSRRHRCEPGPVTEANAGIGSRRGGPLPRATRVLRSPVIPDTGALSVRVEKRAVCHPGLRGEHIGVLRLAGKAHGLREAIRLSGPGPVRYPLGGLT